MLRIKPVENIRLRSSRWLGSVILTLHNMKTDTPITSAAWRECYKDDYDRARNMVNACENLERENARLRKAMARELSENRKLVGAEIERHHLTAFMCAQERRLQNVLST